MLPRRYRLTREEFNAVRDKGRLISGHLFGLLIFCPSNPSNPSNPSSLIKAGLIVSLKLSKKAVIRNLLKRRFRAALRSVLPALKGPIHFIILPNRRALAASVSDLEVELKLSLNNDFFL